jgi:dipeptidase
VCDTLVRVTPGRVLFAKNSDREPDEPQALEWLPRRDGLAGEVRCTHRAIPQVVRTHALVLSRPVWMWGGEMGVNEHGVVIGNEAVFTKEPVPREGGLTGMDLVRLGLERAASAEDAVAVMTALHERYGQGGRCGYEDRGMRYFSSFLVADPAGAFVLETAGRATAVERVTGARSISNGLTIPGFAEAHSDVVKTTVTACRRRRPRTEASAARATGPRDLAGALRDHGAARWPAYEWYRGAMGAPCMHAGGLVVGSQTTASLIVELAGGVVGAWATATSAPCLAVFKPFAVETALDVGPTPGLEPDASLWWTHERLARRVMRDPERRATFFAERDALEARAFAPGADAQAVWDEARAATERWLAEVERQPAGEDRRPWAVRRYWARRRRP